MTSPIDPIRRPAQARRARRTDDQAAAASAAERSETPNLPVPVGQASEAAPPPAAELDRASAFAAQLLGQDGQKRGLRGGPPVLNAAKDTYSRTEWSGPADRRARKGGVAKTEI